MTDYVDPGDSADDGRIKRRGLPRAKHVDQPTLFGDAPNGRGGTTPAPANAGPATRRFDPDTSRLAAKRAADNMTAKQLAVLTLFHLKGEMNDEELVDEYKRLRNAGGQAAAFLPAQADSGIRSRRAELTNATAHYVEYAGYKRTMTKGGKGRVHRLNRNAPGLKRIREMAETGR